MSLESCAGESSASHSPSLLEEEDTGPLAPQPQNTRSTDKEPLGSLGLSHKAPVASECLPFFRTCEWLLAEEKALQTEIFVDQGGQRARQASFLEDLAPPSGFLPYYRSEKDILPCRILPGQGHGGSHDSLPSEKAQEDCCCKLTAKDGCPLENLPNKETFSARRDSHFSGSLGLAGNALQTLSQHHPDSEAEHPAPPAMSSFQLEDFAAGWIGGPEELEPVLIKRSCGADSQRGLRGAHTLRRPGTASVIVGHPLDTVKTRLQAGIGYRSTLSCIRRVYKRESVFGFFKGMSFPLASIAVYNSVVFGVFSNIRRFLGQHHCEEPEAGPRHSLSDLFLASMVAGVVSVGLGGPVDLIKIRLQMQTQPIREANLGLKSRALAFGEQPVYQGPVHCIVTIMRNEGLAGLYRGASAMMLRDIPGYCLYFIPYVFLSEWITPETHTGPSPCTMLLAGGVAGAISWGTATPMDVVKSRLQADGVYLNKYKGVLDCISQSYQQEGLKVSSWQACGVAWGGGSDMWGSNSKEGDREPEVLAVTTSRCHIRNFT
ncbi:Solute carrier family 25 member 48 [Fukomys damarensis]|uniref:Solute carrier family 25 member 48 n=1 Tax=Fukomys damarensis TaxID=885580 RepID=A0A091CMS2_FUKDA|nr:Solute carrier family 25 member 48 [Fukomys damarensis]